MLGLFLVLPVFALEARKYPGGNDPALVGLAMGIYGLTQAVLQIAAGLASDRLGRKRVIVAGLLVFALGQPGGGAGRQRSPGWWWAARCRGGRGVSRRHGLLADQTRDGVRTKAMALVGGSIGLMFALALVAAPALAAGCRAVGAVWMTCALALAGMAVVLWVVPPEPAMPHRCTAWPPGRPVAPWPTCCA
jgi:MFS family permease